MSTDAELRAAIDALTKQVASLEASLAAPLEASHARWATQLQSRQVARGVERERVQQCGRLRRDTAWRSLGTLGRWFAVTRCAFITREARRRQWLGAARNR